MKKPQEAFATTPDEYSQLRLMQLLLSSEALKLVPNYADAQCTDLTAMAGQWRIVEYLVRSNANLETQPRRNARDGGRAPGRVSYRPYLDRHGFGACDLQFEAWAGEASMRLGGALVAGGLAYVALTGTPSPNCSSGSRVVDEAVRPTLAKKPAVAS